MKYQEIRAPGFVIYENGGYDRELAKASVGNGWHSLLDIIFDKLETVSNPPKVIQVKEKWGGLRVYTDYMDTEIDRVIYEMESLSFKTCEVCGEVGALRGRGWYYTSCDAHAKPGDQPHTEDELDA